MKYNTKWPLLTSWSVYIYFYFQKKESVFLNQCILTDKYKCAQERKFLER